MPAHATTDPTAETLEWHAPGAGTWSFDPVHWPDPVSRIVQDVFPAASARGWAPAFVRYGMPVSDIRIEICNDHMYLHVIPIVDGAELERRDATARAAERDKPWLDDAARWYEERRPARHAANLRLQDVEPDALDDAALAAHLDEVVANLDAGITEHFSLVEVGGQVVGRYVHECGGWGIDAADALSLLAGQSPGSSEAARALAALATVVATGAAPTTLDELRAGGAAVTAELDTYLREHGTRIITGYDAEDMTLIEQPDVLLRTIAAAGSVAKRVVPNVAVVRDRVPTGQHERFDSLLADAVAVYGVRDDNEGLTLMWPTGLLRRALLAIGRRLHGRGALNDRRHVFVASQAELGCLLTGGADPTATDLAARQDRRARAAASPPPPMLEGSPAPEPPPLPEHAARAMQALEAAIAAEWDAPGEVTTDGVTGVGIGNGVHHGRACVAATLEEALARLEAGDVLVTPLTSSSFNAVLPLAGALIVEEGGPYCHAAIVARELGLPTIIGARGAMATIPDGALVEVNPAEGRVRVLP